MSEIARKMELSYGHVYRLTRLCERGFSSESEYRDHLAHRKGFTNHAGYCKHLINKNGFGSIGEYRSLLAVRKGYASYGDCLKHQGDARARRSLYKQIGRVVNTLLQESGGTQSWLAKQLGVSRTAARDYQKGRSVPRPQTLEKLIDISEEMTPEEVSRIEEIGRERWGA